MNFFACFSQDLSSVRLLWGCTKSSGYAGMCGPLWELQARACQTALAQVGGSKGWAGPCDLRKVTDAHMLFLQLALRLCLCVSPKARSLWLAGASVLHITQQAHSSSVMSPWTAPSARKIPLNNLRLLFLHKQKGIEQEYKRKWGGVGHYFWNVFVWMGFERSLKCKWIH